MMPGLEAHGDNLGIVFYLLDNYGMLNVFIRITLMRQF